MDLDLLVIIVLVNRRSNAMCGLEKKRMIVKVYFIRNTAVDSDELIIKQRT